MEPHLPRDRERTLWTGLDTLAGDSSLLKVILCSFFHLFNDLYVIEHKLGSSSCGVVLEDASFSQ